MKKLTDMKRVLTKDGNKNIRTMGGYKYGTTDSVKLFAFGTEKVIYWEELLEMKC